MEVEAGQLVSFEGLRKGERTILGAKDVRGSFLKDILLTFALNALYQPYQLY